MKRRNEIVIPKRPPRRPAGHGGMNIVRQMDGVKEYVKEQIERSFNSEIVSDEEKIELLNLIDKQAFLRAKSILEEAAKRATALNQDHLIDTFENLYKKLNWLQLNYSGGAARNH